MRKLPILALLVVALTLPAFAAEKAEGAKKEGGEAKKGKPGTNVDMPFLMAPLTNVEGKLTGYAYISTRLTASTESFALTVREKLPFIQDMMVRDVNGTAVTTAEDPQSVDVPRLESRLLADARKVIGADKVKLFQAIKESLTGMTEEQQEAFSRCSRDPDVAVMLEFYSAMTKARAAEAQAKLDAAAAELARRAAAEAKRLAKEAAAQPPVEAQPEKPVAPAVEVSV